MLVWLKVVKNSIYKLTYVGLAEGSKKQHIYKLTYVGLAKGNKKQH